MKKLLLTLLGCFLLSSTFAVQPSQIKSLLPTSATFSPMESQNQVSRMKLSAMKLVLAGGYGGNKQIGQLTYAGSTNTLPALRVSRDGNMCFLQNDDVIVKDAQSQKIIFFGCSDRDPRHNDLFWDDQLGAVNGGYSPENDVLYAASKVVSMFNDWYQIPPVPDQNGAKKTFTVYLHDQDDNAFWEDDALIVGDGQNIFYPLTSLPVISYLIGGLFTDHHAKLNWFSKEPASISVAFDCMTAMAAEYYTTGKNTWQLGAEISKKGEPLHYMDIPSRNCNGKRPGDSCDIDTLAQYNPAMQPHYASGLFNRAFYLLATTPNWNTHKAYDVFVQANIYHWQSSTNFHSGACDVVASAKELGYEPVAVMRAFSAVGIDTRDCR